MLVSRTERIQEENLDIWFVLEDDVITFHKRIAGSNNIEIVKKLNRMNDFENDISSKLLKEFKDIVKKSTVRETNKAVKVKKKIK